MSVSAGFGVQESPYRAHSKLPQATYFVSNAYVHRFCKAKTPTLRDDTRFDNIIRVLGDLVAPTIVRRQWPAVLLAE
eukprot:1337761-Rhodomonas_salina.1